MTALPSTVRELTAADDSARDAFCDSHPDASFFHLSGWRNVIQRVFRHTPAELAAERDGELTGILPMMSCTRLLGGRNLISMPYGVYGGVIAEDDDTERALLEAAVTRADKAGVGHLELRYMRDPGPDLAGSDLYWTFRRALPETEEEVLSRMPKKARAEARKARDKHGLELSEGEWYADDLYRLFVANKHGLGSPALPQAMFTELLREFPDRCTVHLVRRGTEPLAAVMSFAYRGTLYAYYSGTAPGADRSYSASNFMYLALQQWAVRQGFTCFDFGRSRQDAGAFRFKTHQGFEAEPLYYRYHLVRNRKLPSFNPSNPKTALLQDTWRRLPRGLARRLSDRLARYLP